MSQEKSNNSWSYSRSKLFESCPRAFYYKVFNSKHRYAKMIPQRAIIGIAVHTAISTLVDDWVSDKRISFIKIKNVGEQYVKGVCSNPKNNIVEISNGMNFDANNIQRFLSVTNLRIKSFYKMIWPRFQNHEHVSHEKLDRFKLDDMQILVKADLCTKDNQKKMIITDWKLDKSSIYNRDYLQLYIYSLWANKVLKEKISNIFLQIVNINTGETIKLLPTNKPIESIIKKIKHDCIKWQKLQKESDYKANVDYHNCISCGFLSRCKEGKAQFSLKKFL